MAGALKTLFTTLAASSYMSGISLAFGEEEESAQDYALPLVVMVPKGGNYKDGVGYSAGLDPTVEMVWGIESGVDFFIWASASSGLPIDNADAVETTRLAVLSALQDQRAQLDANGNNVLGGLYYRPVNESWQLMQGARIRYGRALVISTIAEISVAPAPPANAQVTSESITYTVVDAPS